MGRTTQARASGRRRPRLPARRGSVPPASSSERQQEVRGYTSPPALRTDGTPHGRTTHGPRTDHAPRACRGCAVRAEYTTLAHARESPQGGDTAPYGDRL